MTKDAILALGLLLRYYYFDCFGFPLVCLHLLWHALYLLWMDFHPCLYIYTGFSLTNGMYALIVPYLQWGFFDTQAIDHNRRFWKSDSIDYTDIQWSIQRIPHHCTYLTMNKKRLLQMQFNIKVRTTIAWQKAQHQKYSSTTIAYWKTHTVFAYLTSGALWSSFGSLQLSSILVFFCTKRWWWWPFLPSFRQFLSAEPHAFALGFAVAQGSSKTHISINRIWQ